MVDKFLGNTGWTDMSSIAQIDRAILRDKGQELVVELKHGGWVYVVKLKHRENRNYEGNWEARKGGENDSGKASCQVFDAPMGRFFFGEWTEGGDRNLWWGRLEAVEKFPDESNI